MKSHLNMNPTRKTFALLSTSALAAGAAQGAVLYQPIDVTIPGNATLTLDLNQDSTPDFKILGHTSKPYLDNTPNSGAAFVLSDGTTRGLPLTTAGTMVDGSYQSAQSIGYFAKNYTTGDPAGSWTAAGDNEGYVGLQLTDGAGTHYGWAHFIWNQTNAVPHGNATGTLRLIDAAMETADGVGVLAGQTANAGVPVVAVPPSPTTGYPGGTAQLSVIAQGFPAPSFQWRAGAVGSGIYTNLPNGAGVSHGALNNLTLQNLTLANMADYVVVASNPSGSVTSSVPATLTVLPTSDFPATLVHRYSFQDTAGSTTFADSVGGPAWDGTLQGSAALDGSSLQLDGSDGCFATLPPYIMSDYTQMTVEFWVDVAPSNPVWTYVFSFGEQAGGIKASGVDYCPYADGNYQNSDLRNSSGFVYANKNVGLLGTTGNHVTLIADPVNNVLSFYNGPSFVSTLNLGGPSGAASAVPSLAGINDVDNWIGRSLHLLTDPYFAGTIHEFRVYKGLLPVQAIALNDAVGPDQYIQLSANPTLSASLSGGNIVLSWPASDYGFAVQAKSGLTSATTWTTLGDMPVLVGGNWQVSVPVTGTPQYFQLIH
jgi:hypothetical protein